MESITTLERRIDSLTAALLLLAKTQGARLTRNQMCERLDVHRNTLTKRLTEPGFPQPGRDGKWLLSEVIEWEQLHH
jgi:predicted DNA-binding transcriptional regulator AlpA